MNTCTCTLTSQETEARKQYGHTLFANFQKVIRSPGFAKNEYWRDSEFSYLNALENNTPADIEALIIHRSTQQAQNNIDGEIQKSLPSQSESSSPADRNMLIFINGLESDAHRTLHDPGLCIENSAKVIDRLYPQSLRQLQSKGAAQSSPASPDLMVTFNTALAALSEGVSGERHETFIRIPKDSMPKEPLHLIFLHTKEAQDHISASRVHVHLEQGAALTLVEIHQGDQASIQNTYVNIVMDAGSTLTHVQEMQDGADLNHVHTTHTTLHENSSYRVFAIQRGGQSTVMEKIVSLSGEGASSHLYGLGLGQNRQHFNNILSLDHKVPQTASKQLYKFVLDDFARGGFTGNVIVQRDAQQMQSEQLCKTLLIGERAQMVTRPQLEIFADDVKCGHGATIGQLDPEEIFYLISRGLTEEMATTLLSQSFIRDFFTILQEHLPSNSDSATDLGKTLALRAIE